MTRQNIMWTTRQLKRLAECYAVMPLAELERELAPHSAASIRAMASAMGIKRSVGMRDWKAIAAAHVPVFSFGRRTTEGTN
jgi:hypothetical protein